MSGATPRFSAGRIAFAVGIAVYLVVWVALLVYVRVLGYGVAILFSEIALFPFALALWMVWQWKEVREVYFVVLLGLLLGVVGVSARLWSKCDAEGKYVEFTRVLQADPAFRDLGFSMRELKGRYCSIDGSVASQYDYQRLISLVSVYNQCRRRYWHEDEIGINIGRVQADDGSLPRDKQ